MEDGDEKLVCVPEMVISILPRGLCVPEACDVRISAEPEEVPSDKARHWRVAGVRERGSQRQKLESRL